jgi:hypothetical protein
MISISKFRQNDSHKNLKLRIFEYSSAILTFHIGYVLIDLGRIPWIGNQILCIRQIERHLLDNLLSLLDNLLSLVNLRLNYVLLLDILRLLDVLGLLEVLWLLVYHLLFRIDSIYLLWLGNTHRLAKTLRLDVELLTTRNILVYYFLLVWLLHKNLLISWSLRYHHLTLSTIIDNSRVDRLGGCLC